MSGNWGAEGLGEGKRHGSDRSDCVDFLGDKESAGRFETDFTLVGKGEGRYVREKKREESPKLH